MYKRQNITITPDTSIIYETLQYDDIDQKGIIKLNQFKNK